MTGHFWRNIQILHEDMTLSRKRKKIIRQSKKGRVGLKFYSTKVFFEYRCCNHLTVTASREKTGENLGKTCNVIADTILVFQGK